MKSPTRYLSFKLFLLLMVVMLVVFSIYTYVSITTTSSTLTDYVMTSADRASDLIVRSTRYSMLLNRKEDVHQIIRTIGSEPGFVGINIYNKLGETIFSTDSLEIGRTVDLQAQACHICHASGAPLVSVPTETRVRVYESPVHGHIIGLINPIRNEPACYTAACHAHSPEQNVLGVVDVQMSLAGVDAKVAEARSSLIVSSLAATLLIATISGVFIYRVVRKPLRRLHTGMETISQGDLDATIAIESDDELGRLACAFNRMAEDLKKAHTELEEWGHHLEERIAMKTEELQKVQGQVIHMEKMASLGKLSASVAHEINNPLFGILTYAKLCLREIKDGQVNAEKFQRYLSVIQQESSRCGDIVKNLLDFARRTGGQFERHHLNRIVEQTLFLLAHHFEMKQITVSTDFTGEDDVLVCDAKQIQQAIMAPCINAVEAMPNGGALAVRTRGDDDTVTLDITDTGIGIPEDALPNVFEPFFTTKEGEAGLGLGLAVVYGIVQRHQGHIDIQSTPNQGTTLTIALPRKPVIPSDEQVPEEGAKQNTVGITGRVAPPADVGS